MSRARSVRVSVCVVLVILLISAAPQVAWADPPVNGCKFPGTSPTIQYKLIAVQSNQSTAVINGASAWNVEAAAGVLSLTTGSDPEINIEDGEYSFDAVAVAYGGCNSGGGQPWYNDLVTIKFDISKMSGYSTTGRKLIAIHEFGHAYGLAHAQVLGCGDSFASVMAQSAVYVWVNCGDSSAPYNGDVRAVNSVY